jgi:hypothetical protein
MRGSLDSSVEDLIHYSVSFSRNPTGVSDLEWQ